LTKFSSVQFDPEVWDIVQKKFQQFENLHRELEDHQSRRRDLLKQLSTVNESIADLQQQLTALSGKEKVEQLAAQSDDAEAEQALSAEPEPAPAAAPEVSATDVEEPDQDEPTVGLSPLPEEEPVEAVENHQTDEAAKEWPEVADAKAEAPGRTIEPDTTPYEPVVEPAVETPAPAAEPAPTVTFAQPSAEPAPTDEPATPHEASADQPKESTPAPLEVQELQRLFDEADTARRQSDSALKLVQLYDGKAEVFFEAMCRSHKQNGLTDDEARKEAIKDVNTMIATAKSSQNKPQAAPQDDKKKNGGMRRLFNH
jgi:hypothetical protein